jgi:hypothetical protein
MSKPPSTVQRIERPALELLKTLAHMDHRDRMRELTAILEAEVRRRKIKRRKAKTEAA